MNHCVLSSFLLFLPGAFRAQSHEGVGRVGAGTECGTTWDYCDQAGCGAASFRALLESVC